MRKLSDTNKIKSYSVNNINSDFLKVKYNHLKENEIIYNSNNYNTNGIFIADTTCDDLKVRLIFILKFGHFGHTCTVLDFSINTSFNNFDDNSKGLLKIVSVSNDNMVNIWCPDNKYL